MQYKSKVCEKNFKKCYLIRNHGALLKSPIQNVINNTNLWPRLEKWTKKFVFLCPISKPTLCTYKHQLPLLCRLCCAASHQIYLIAFYHAMADPNESQACRQAGGEGGGRPDETAAPRPGEAHWAHSD